LALPVSQQANTAGILKVGDGYSGSGMGLSISPFGAAKVDISGSVPTYSGGIINFTPQATPADFFTLTGNPLVIAALRRVEVWIGATAAASMELQLVFNSLPNLGGTSAVPVSMPVDPNAIASSCALAAYSVAPTTAGTQVGMLACGRANGPITNGAGGSTPLFWEWSAANDQAPKLRNANQQIALNGNGAALPAGIKFSIRFTWTEISVSIPGA
jgi:hypothetical protein